MNRYDQDPPEAEPKGYWCHNEEPGRNAGTIVHYTEKGRSYDHGFEVTFYHGQQDGKPVIQIDGEGDWRINVNESTVYDRGTDSESQVHLAALAHYKQLAGLQGEHYLDLAKLRAELTDIGFTVPQPRLSNSEVRVALKMIKEQRGDWRQLLDDLFDNFNK